MIRNEPDAYTAIAQAAVVAIRGSLNNITAALSTASGNIIRATTTALGELNTAAANLAQSEVDLLVQELGTIVTILQNINATVTVVSTRLGIPKTAAIWAFTRKYRALVITS